MHRTVSNGGVDERSLEQVIKKPWASDGSNFSERIWKDRNSLVSELDTQLKRNIALGKGPDEAAKAIAKRFETSKSNAYRLVMTESAAISARATEDCYNELGVEEFEVLETLDRHTCEICGAMDGKHFPKSQYEIGVTVPPFHPRCRGTTVPYFDDMEEYGERFARDLDGSTYYVPADTTYEQWKNSQKAFTNDENDDIMKTERFRSLADPMFEVTGNAFDSNPQEVEDIMSQLKDWGIEININDNGTMGYGAVSVGKPGVFSISSNASYSAWMHEFQHVADDKNAGWNAAYVLFCDKDERIRRELSAYQVEIDIAKKMNRPDMIQRLEALQDDEIRKIEQFFSAE